MRKGLNANRYIYNFCDIGRLSGQAKFSDLPDGLRASWRRFQASARLLEASCPFNKVRIDSSYILRKDEGPPRSAIGQSVK